MGVSLCFLSAKPCPISLFTFKFVLIVHIRPAFYGNVNKNRSESVQMCYDHYNAMLTIRMAYEYVAYMLFMDFRSMLLIFASLQTPKEHLRTTANFLRSLEIGPELHLLAYL